MPSELLALAEPNQPARLTITGNQVVAIATPVDYRALPNIARTTCEAVAPNGELTFCGQERGPRGHGFRVEKTYRKPAGHIRSVLVDVAGTILERSHTVPLGKVPQHVLAAALQLGTFVESAEIVSGPAREEFWRVVVKDRRSRVFVARIDLEGELLAQMRRTLGRVDS